MTDRSNTQAEREAREIVRRANILYFRSKVYERTRWMGVPALKCPLDMWIYQELVHELHTDLVIETGTFAGGSALFFAHLFDAVGKGHVLSVDLELRPDLPVHPRIEYLEGSSVAAPVLAQVGERCAEASSVLVILDSDHSAAYKLDELTAYAPFVTPGSYLVAEDTTFDHFPSWPEFGPGPAEAVRKFLARNDDFEADRAQERHLITFAPAAFLRRRA